MSKVDYVDNKEFSIDVWEYVKARKTSVEEAILVIPDNVALAFYKIANGLSHKPSFIRYPFREDMVMDAVENCLKAVPNYDPDVETRTGVPNAFSYFTTVCYNAFLRRIKKEKKYMYNYYKILSSSSIDDLVLTEDDSHSGEVTEYIESLKKDVDTFIADYEKGEERRKEKQLIKDGDKHLKGFDLL